MAYTIRALINGREIIRQGATALEAWVQWLHLDLLGAEGIEVHGRDRTYTADEIQKMANDGDVAR
jgi:hypothetical protein